jgi:hypothetical protein
MFVRRRCYVLESLQLAAGRTDHVWSLREVLVYRVPPAPQPAWV